MNLTRKKLIEVSLPLDSINAASTREKSIRHGHPSTLHLWWARRPLAAARAVIFAQLVDDPSTYIDELLASPEKRESAQRTLVQRQQTNSKSADREEIFDMVSLREVIAELERKRLFKILEELVLWENTTNERVLDQARNEIWQSWKRECAVNANHPQADELYRPDRLPVFHDPFAGGGSLPLEAQRLGLEAHASDLNPVAVLINKAMIEVPPKFAGHEPVNPDSRYQSINKVKMWRGAQGLAEDIRYYGQWMKNEAKKRIGNYYPTVEITSDMTRERMDLKPYVGKNLTVIAWLWARTVKSPNPAFANIDVPLVSTFMLSTKKGKEAYVEPVIEGSKYHFKVRIGMPPNLTKTKRGTKSGDGNSPFICLISGSPMPFTYLRSEGKAGRLGSRLLAVVVEGIRNRVYLSPTSEQELLIHKAKPEWIPKNELPQKALGFRIQEYGMRHWCDLFNLRQLVALSTFADLVNQTMERVHLDAVEAGVCDNNLSLDNGGSGAKAYAEAVSLYLAICASKAADSWSTIASWIDCSESLRNTFARQALPMIWDYAESNPFSSSCGNWEGTCLNLLAKVIENLPQQQLGHVKQEDAVNHKNIINAIISTDPPYYDNIGYADLSDFFYIWLRRSLKPLFSKLFATLAAPKNDELVATPYRHGGKKAAEAFFLKGMTQAIRCIADQIHPDFPITIYYAFKQSEQKGDGIVASTGWETFLDAIIRSGLSITGTWPMRTERRGRSNSIKANALASSIVLVCRRQSTNIKPATRREFVTALKLELPQALRFLQSGNVAPVDLAQAAIGPGMAVYTRYASSVTNLFNYVSPPPSPPSYSLISIAA